MREKINNDALKGGTFCPKTRGSTSKALAKPALERQAPAMELDPSLGAFLAQRTGSIAKRRELSSPPPNSTQLALVIHPACLFSQIPVPRSALIPYFVQTSRTPRLSREDGEEGAGRGDVALRVMMYAKPAQLGPPFPFSHPIWLDFPGPLFGRAVASGVSAARRRSSATSRGGACCVVASHGELAKGLSVG